MSREESKGVPSMVLWLGTKRKENERSEKGSIITDETKL